LVIKRLLIEYRLIGQQYKLSTEIIVICELDNENQVITYSAGNDL